MKAKEVAFHIVGRNYSPFNYRRNLVVVPNVSYGLLDYEADLLVCSKAGYLTEVEVKVSWHDWVIDAYKSKWEFRRANIKYFYYAAPMKLAQRWEEHLIAKELEPTMEPRQLRRYREWLRVMKDEAGIVGVSDSGVVGVIREAKAASGATKLSIEQQLKLARLGAIRCWTRDYSQLPDDTCAPENSQLIQPDQRSDNSC